MTLETYGEGDDSVVVSMTSYSADALLGLQSVDVPADGTSPAVVGTGYYSRTIVHPEDKTQQIFMEDENNIAFINNYKKNDTGPVAPSAPDNP